MASRPTVAVIGAGFSGLLTALHLLSAPDGPQVQLIERRGAFGRGRAYETDNPDHLLNVRVASMSALPDQPDHFVQWLSHRDGWRATGAFVTRGVYGDYLQSLLGGAVQGAYGVGRLLLELDEAVDARPVRGGWEIETAMGRTLFADAVVLALGAPPSAPPPGASPELLASPRYLADPWAAGASTDVGRHVLLLGAGLTMVDVAFALSRGYRRFTAISRRGLVSLGHDGRPPATGRTDLAGSPAEVLRQVRRSARGRDWREAVDEARGSAQDVWRAWSLAERRRFLRHLRPWWDIHRHRMAPSVARRVQEMRKAGELVVRAGAIERLDLAQDEVRVEWRARGTRKPQTLMVDAVVNCTGAGGEIGLADPRLIGALLGRRLVRPDPCRLGLDVDAGSRPLNAKGVAQRGLYAVGPLTRSAFWEITAVPDIRSQAATVARDLLAELAARRRA
ncbi:MAG TPA: FAD/NAD(P)-binding protein [Phenylobacterium sp.]|uniref:FAD/NAD(P)-binding protein n=1 Tax=Phenylobacterium sp. TaxID=1871053 RepID=UPI002B487760|nr:FAD/NAD(P)-binding protein [Phenylobacterium sp.]HKR89691.1 FAD/NAD(P)-binding protein [Phenylobacterium sp.]